MADISDNLMLDSWDNDDYYFNEISNPRVLEARANTSKYNEDNPSFDTATRGPFQAQFWQAMRTKFNTLTQDFDCWEYVPNPGKDVLPSTWAFKIKRYPDGLIKKFKFVCGETSNKKESTILRPGLQSFNGRRCKLL
jgi:hypothetical protein